MGQFGIKANETSRIADVLTAAVGASSLNIDRMSVAFRNSGLTAANSNNSLEQTTAVLGILTNTMGSGEAAGTGFKSALNELRQKGEDLGITVMDSTGKMRPMVDILMDMEEKGWSAEEAVAKFGVEAGPTLAALLTESSKGLRDMTGKVQSSGQAAKTAGEQNSGLMGSLDNLMSKVSAASLLFGEQFAPAMQKAVDTVAAFLVTDEARKAMEKFGEAAGEVVEKLVPFVKYLINNMGPVLNQIVGWVMDTVRAIQNMIDLMNSVSGFFGFGGGDSGGFATGTDQIQKDGLYRLHQGERVVSNQNNGDLATGADQGDFYRFHRGERIANHNNGGFATGADQIPQDGVYQLHQGERVISNSTSFGDFTFNIAGGSQSPEDWREITRRFILPEIRAAVR